MPKNIVLLSDGTGNSAGKFNHTNVWRTYETLDLSDPAKQIAYYDDGVGTSAFRPLALLGGAFGIGISRNVRELYVFLCRHYEAGDRIYGFGFSRGAFTIRLLVGFVAYTGILKKSEYAGEQELWKKVTWLYRAYRKNHSKQGDDPIFARIIRGLRDSLPGQSFGRNPLPETAFHQPDIQFIGLWDTVDAYGLPIKELTMVFDRIIWPISMRNYDLSSKVKRAAHALALDDERNTFHPLLWNEESHGAKTATQDPVSQDSSATNISQERLTQVWFSGMHANVGGGYPDDFLSLVPLNWILKLAKQQHLLVRADKLEDYALDARAEGVMHYSRQGLQSLYRLLPRNLAVLTDSERRFFGKSFKKMDPAKIVRIARPKIHHSVFERIKFNVGGYSPIVLPADYAVVGSDGTISDLGTGGYETADQAKGRVKAQEAVWDMVWLQRCNYYVTLALLMILAFMPWLPYPIMSASDCQVSLLATDNECAPSVFWFVSYVVELIGNVLPAFLALWIKTFSTNPMIVALIVAAIFFARKVSSSLDLKAHDRMRAIWDNPGTVSDAYSKMTLLRKSGAYQSLFRAVTQYVVPIIFAFGLQVAIVVGFAAFFIKTWL